MSKIERAPTLTPGGTSKSKEEKIFVTVRVRPLSKKELAMKDQVVWECADSQTILYKGPPQDRAAPTSYTFGTMSRDQINRFCCHERSDLLFD